MAKKPSTPKSVETLKHDEDKRKNIPTAEYQSVLEKEQQDPKKVRYPRNTDLRDRLTVARDLLTDAGSIFVQIGDENVHRVRAVMDEIFGDENFVSEIHFRINDADGVRRT